MSEQNSPIQKILFGSPGTGKSHKVLEIAKNELSIKEKKQLTNIVKTVFHPEYTHADFMGKLLPLTQNNSVIYKFYPGHFLRVLGMAYKSLIDDTKENFLLVIDELNRGNAAAIFGNAFQLLDRDDDGWSNYEVDISEMELVGLFNLMGLKPINQNGVIKITENKSDRTYEDFCQEKAEKFKIGNNTNGSQTYSLLKQCKIKIPPNLSIIATINTSDESIYYLDSAFKRRWDWQYIDSPSANSINSSEEVPEELRDIFLTNEGEEWCKWYRYIIGINEFIKSNSQTIRRIEDKQVGWWFIKPKDGKVELKQVKDKLMFYLWDSVFARDKKPLEDLLSNNSQNRVKLILYSDFLNLTEKFLEEIVVFG